MRIEILDGMKHIVAKEGYILINEDMGLNATDIITPLSLDENLIREEKKNDDESSVND